MCEGSWAGGNSCSDSRRTDLDCMGANTNSARQRAFAFYLPCSGNNICSFPRRLPPCGRFSTSCCYDEQNVRAELNWMPYWAGERFAEVIGQWIDMIPNDRMLYGTDSAGLSCLTHDMVTREGLAQALEVRVSRGGLSKPAALQIAANLLRNNAIDVYSLSLPKYVV